MLQGTVLAGPVTSVPGATAAVAAADTGDDSENDYPVNFPEGTKITDSGRKLNSISLTDMNGNVQTVNVGQGKDLSLYIDCLDKGFTAKRNDLVTISLDWNGSWMHGYVYIDKENDGKFDVTEDYKGDLVAYSYYNGTNSNGETAAAGTSIAPPSFRIPALPAGVYRMRIKIDWDCVDPAGNDASSNLITNNGGAIVDTRLMINNGSVKVSVEGEGGTVTKADGTALGSTPFGKELTIKVQPETGKKLALMSVVHGVLGGEQFVHGTPQYLTETLYAYQMPDGVYTMPASWLDGDVKVSAKFIADNSVGGKDYPLGFDEKLAVAATENRLDALTVTGAGNGNTVVSTADAGTVYVPLKDENVVSVGQGETVNVALNYSGAPLHSYLYIDYGNDGAFDLMTDAGGNVPSGAALDGGDLVSYTYLKGKNSLGEEVAETESVSALPAFTVPVSLPAGVYRARLKMDWDNADPAGRYAEEGTHSIDRDGGRVVDFLLNVHGTSDKLQLFSTNGSLVGAGNTGMPGTINYNESLTVVPVAAAAGYKAETMTVRHGHHLDGAQYVHGNRQWQEYTVPAATYTLPAADVDGEVRVTIAFEETAEAVYKQVFADEFDLPDGSAPDANKWSHCDVGHGITWKRFVAQTAEGRKQTAYIEDGMLVTLCKPNTLATEKDASGEKQQMISGAVESSGTFGFTYGKVEGRLQTNPYTGNFPAFWMMPVTSTYGGWPKSGEIDIWEQIDTQNTAFHTIHSQWANEEGGGSNPQKGGQESYDATQFHVFGLEWTENKLVWYMDGKQVFSYAKSTSQAALSKNQWPFNQHFYLILNQSVGNGSWAKPADTKHTYKTVFDWVRVYQKDGQTNTGIADAPAADDFDVYVRGDKVIVVAPETEHIRICDIQGRQIYSRNVQGNVSISLPKGAYVLNGRKVLVP